MLAIILGFIAGGMIGTGAMALLQAKRAAEYAARIRDLKELLDPYDDTDGIKVKYVRQLFADGMEENE